MVPPIGGPSSGCQHAGLVDAGTRRWPKPITSAGHLRDVAWSAAGIAGPHGSACCARQGLSWSCWEGPYRRSGGAPGTSGGGLHFDGGGAPWVAGLEPGRHFHSRCFRASGLARRRPPPPLDPGSAVVGSGRMASRRSGSGAILAAYGNAGSGEQHFSRSDRSGTLRLGAFKASWGIAGRAMPVAAAPQPLGWHLIGSLRARQSGQRPAVWERSVAICWQLRGLRRDKPRLAPLLDLQLRFYPGNGLTRTAALYGATVSWHGQEPQGLWT